MLFGLGLLLSSSILFPVPELSQALVLQPQVPVVHRQLLILPTRRSPERLQAHGWQNNVWQVWQVTPLVRTPEHEVSRNPKARRFAVYPASDPGKSGQSEKGTTGCDTRVDSWCLYLHPLTIASCSSEIIACSR